MEPRPGVSFPAECGPLMRKRAASAHPVRLGPGATGRWSLVLAVFTFVSPALLVKSQLVGPNSPWPLDASLFPDENPFVAAYGNEPTVCKDVTGQVVTCKQINILHGLFMNAGPTHIAFAMMSTLHIAAHWINQDQYLLPGYELVLHTRDTEWTATAKDMIVADELLNQSAATKYAGTISSFNLDGGYVYLMNKVQMPLMTGSISQQMADPDLMPGAITPVNHAGQALPAIKKVFEKCSWTGLGIVVDPEQFGYEAERFQAAMIAAGYTIDFYAELNTVSQVDDVITQIKSSRTRVVMFFGEADPLVWLACAFHLESMSKILIMQWPAIPWFLNSGNAQSTECMNPNTLLKVLKNNYIGFYPMTVDGSTSTEPLTCHPNITREAGTAEMLAYMSTALTAAGATFGAVSHMAGGADLVCMMSLYFKHMLFNQSHTLEELASRTEDIYQEYLDWAWPDFQGFAGDFFFQRYYNDEGTAFSGGRATMLEIIQITGENFLLSPYVGASMPWDVGMIYPNYEVQRDGTVIDGFVDALTFDGGVSTCPDNYFPACPEGQELLMGECVECEAGYYLGDDGECVACASGAYQSLTGQTVCLACDLGTYTNTTASTDCVACAAGQHRPTGTAATSCLPCDVGTFSDEAQRSSSDGMAKCQSCPVGSYADQTSSTECTLCPSGLTTKEKGGTSVADCICSEGTYLDAGGSCASCPEGMECALGSSVASDADVKPTLLEGFWSSSEDPFSIYTCNSVEQCPGGLPGEACGPHLQGQGCAHCVKGYILLENSCIECSDFEKSAALFPLIPIFAGPFVVVGMYLLSASDVGEWKHWRKGMAGMGFVLLNHYQMINLLNLPDMEAPNTLTSVLNVWRFSSDVMSIFRPPCVGMSSFFQSLLLKSMLPVVVLAVFVATALVARLLATKCGKNDLNMDFNRVCSCYFSIVFAFFAAISQAAFTVAKCSPNPNDDWTLTADRSVTCFEGDWWGMLIVGALAVLLWLGGFGALFTWAIISAPANWTKKSHRMRWKFLYIKFRPQCFFFSMVICAKGVLTNVGFIFFSQALLQVYWTLSCIAVYCGLVAVYSPWRIKQINVVDISAHLSLIFLGFMLTIFLDPDDAMERTVSVLSIIVSFLTGVICIAAGILMFASQTNAWMLARRARHIEEVRVAVTRLGELEPERFQHFMDSLIDHDLDAFVTGAEAMPKDLLEKELVEQEIVRLSRVASAKTGAEASVSTLATATPGENAAMAANISWAEGFLTANTGKTDLKTVILV